MIWNQKEMKSIRDRWLEMYDNLVVMNLFPDTLFISVGLEGQLNTLDSLTTVSSNHIKGVNLF